MILLQQDLFHDSRESYPQSPIKQSHQANLFHSSRTSSTAAGPLPQQQDLFHSSRTSSTAAGPLPQQQDLFHSSRTSSTAAGPLPQQQDLFHSSRTSSIAAGIDTKYNYIAFIHFHIKITPVICLDHACFSLAMHLPVKIPAKITIRSPSSPKNKTRTRGKDDITSDTWSPWLGTFKTLYLHRKCPAFDGLGCTYFPVAVGIGRYDASLTFFFFPFFSFFPFMMPTADGLLLSLFSIPAHLYVRCTLHYFDAAAGFGTLVYSRPSKVSCRVMATYYYRLFCDSSLRHTVFTVSLLLARDRYRTHEKSKCTIQQDADSAACPLSAYLGEQESPLFPRPPFHPYHSCGSVALHTLYENNNYPFD
ncbi:hypothetical protein ACRALDRAFT_2047640 [Sodiomyces alcalophilus JCM 7366]|uniref:uncharacterized protein n=1 Tax=Sodiomyces alcalophilus JCM 7366 TaxID=591952 RepID=UPI0039B6406D